MSTARKYGVSFRALLVIGSSALAQSSPPEHCHPEIERLTRILKHEEPTTLVSPVTGPVATHISQTQGGLAGVYPVSTLVLYITSPGCQTFMSYLGGPVCYHVREVCRGKDEVEYSLSPEQFYRILDYNEALKLAPPRFKFN